MADILSPQMIRFELMSKIWLFILEYESDPDVNFNLVWFSKLPIVTVRSCTNTKLNAK